MSIIIYTCPKCGGDLIEEVICTYPPINKTTCTKCGWTYEEMETIEKIPFPINDIKFIHCDSSISMACKNCSNHPSNGGSGICHCTLGSPTITC